MHSKRLFSHFVLTAIASSTILFTSTIVATFVVSANVATQLTVVMLIHIFTLYTIFNLRTDIDLDVRVNPYITLFEWISNNRKFSFPSAMVEWLGQLCGFGVATALLYGTVVIGQFGFLGPVNIPEGGRFWAFFLEFFTTMIFAFVYFHNYYYRNSFNLAYTVATAVGITSAIVYPVIGATTHNPLRYLTACLAANTCSGTWYIYIVGPLVGVATGFLLSLCTQWNTRDGKRHLKRL